MINLRRLEIKRKFLREMHQEAEKIISKDSFTHRDVELLQGYYNMCEEYSGDFLEFVSADVNSLKANLAKILNERWAGFNIKSEVAKAKKRKKKLSE